MRKKNKEQELVPDPFICPVTTRQAHARYMLGTRKINVVCVRDTFNTRSALVQLVHIRCVFVGKHVMCALVVRSKSAAELATDTQRRLSVRLAFVQRALRMFGDFMAYRVMRRALRTVLSMLKKSRRTSEERRIHNVGKTRSSNA